ncbi:hypothetical protein [Paraburkholderia sp. Cpub6]|uniref:hypothetical protein n=1 Tax=Paraburkholderia sp. Cpub6 TaxID=2723094 RepID=UPI00161FAD00|nr:hypothetical protein [Paraburkholderia sp. Cpub6]MBB5462916.1 hypothetical protein [Paraburkholderia sp. Cpub6]
MPKWLLTYSGAVLAVGAIVVTQNLWDLSKSDWASWVQAVGAIAAIVGAIWISNSQYRREETRRASEEALANYRLMAELNWLSDEIVGFLNQFADFEPGQNDTFVIADDEVADILTRLTWCRQHVEHKGQLAMLGTLRHSFVETLRLVRVKAKYNSTVFGIQDLRILREWRKEALGVLNHAVGVEPKSHYRSTHEKPQTSETA